jgi:FkbM family methyltransferase
MLSGALITLRQRGPSVLAWAIVNAAGANLQKLVLGRRFIERRIHNYRMLLDLEDKGISRSLILFGTREVDHKIILEKVLKPGMAVLDIGANLGYYVLMEMGLIGPSGRMVAIEPSPSNVELLKRNLALNGHHDVPVIAGAVSDSAGEREFFLAHQSNLNTFHTTGSGRQHLSGKTVKVRTYTVPELAASHGKPDLIRMDVEGHEVEVFNGLIPAVERGELAPMIIFETHLSRYGADHDMEAPLRRLFAAGYGVRYLASSSERGTGLIDSRGYRGVERVRTDDVERVIYENIRAEDAIELICRTGGARTVLLQKSR